MPNKIEDFLTTEILSDNQLREYDDELMSLIGEILFLIRTFRDLADYRSGSINKFGLKKFEDLLKVKDKFTLKDVENFKKLLDYHNSAYEEMYEHINFSSYFHDTKRLLDFLKAANKAKPNEWYEERIQFHIASRNQVKDLSKIYEQVYLDCKAVLEEISKDPIKEIAEYFMPPQTQGSQDNNPNIEDSEEDEEEKILRERRQETKLDRLIKTQFIERNVDRVKLCMELVKDTGFDYLLSNTNNRTTARIDIANQLKNDGLLVEADINGIERNEDGGFGAYPGDFNDSIRVTREVLDTIAGSSFEEDPQQPDPNSSDPDYTIVNESYFEPSANANFASDEIPTDLLALRDEILKQAAEDENIQSIIRERSVAYHLHPTEVHRHTLFRARGSDFPKWFPGIQLVFPDSEDLKPTAVDPTNAMWHAWELVKPTEPLLAFATNNGFENVD